MTKPIKVPFHGTSLVVVDHDGEPYTPLKPIAEGMGLAWQPQHAKLQANAARWGITVIVIPSKGGKQEAACIPLRKLAGWLMTLHPSRVKPELREKITTYQNECDDALWKYWNEGTAQRRAKPGANALTVQPAPQARADFDLRAVMLEDNSTPTVALPPEVQAALNRKAWALAGSAYDLLREYLARRVAYASECGQPRRINEARAKAIIAETTLDMALAPKHYNMLHGVLTTMEMVANVANDSLAKMREELKQKGMVQ